MATESKALLPLNHLSSTTKQQIAQNGMLTLEITDKHLMNLEAVYFNQTDKWHSIYLQNITTLIASQLNHT